ncbi:Retinol dehydrogenase 12 [Cladobotryum mycophilum]|uniref:Retinol dehydrogenase 12 n=1 Tax=Cladobotryum mycophilum TaxID=491253 RepID=A0ABR0SBR2_9HYPO
MPAQQKILPSETILEQYGKSLAGKVVLITGVSNDSIAGELAVQLSTANPSLLILSARSEARVEPIVEKINEKNPRVAIRFLKMDLSDLSDIRRAAKSLDDVPKIDHIAAVAGVMVPPYSKTVDGVESQFGVNYLANFLLVKLLLPKVEAASPTSSIIIVASSAVRSGKVNFDDINYDEGKTYDALPAYGQSNAARVMFVKRLAEKLKGKKIRTYSIDPGAVESGLQRHFNPELLAFIDRLRASGEPLRDLDGKEFDMPTWTNTSEGAATIITGMIDPTIENSNGSFLHNNALANDELHAHIRDENNWTKLWELSEELIGEKFVI